MSLFKFLFVSPNEWTNSSSLLVVEEIALFFLAFFICKLNFLSYFFVYVLYLLFTFSICFSLMMLLIAKLFNMTTSNCNGMTTVIVKINNF